ncbi:MAG: 2-oxoglutarate dehydrogenase component, partial [Actinomycetota bacterium]
MAGMTPDNKFGGSFGSNEWLVDEMYERYLADPNSVEDDWKEFFAGYKPGNHQGNNPGTTTSPGVPPIPKRQQQPQAPVNVVVTPEPVVAPTPQPTVRPTTQP